MPIVEVYLSFPAASGFWKAMRFLAPSNGIVIVCQACYYIYNSIYATASADVACMHAEVCAPRR